MKKPRLGKEIKWDENIKLPPPVVFKNELEKEIKKRSKDLRWIREAEIRCVPRARMIQRGPSPDLVRTHTNAPQSANISLRSGRGARAHQAL